MVRKQDGSSKKIISKPEFKKCELFLCRCFFPFFACLTLKVIISFLFQLCKFISTNPPSTWSSLFPILSQYVPWLLHPMMPVPRVFAKKHSLLNMCFFLIVNDYNEINEYLSIYSRVRHTN